MTVVLAGLANDRTAHVLEDIDERHVSLDARGAQPFDRKRALGDGRQGEKVTRGGCVRLDRISTSAIMRRIDVEIGEICGC